MDPKPYSIYLQGTKNPELFIETFLRRPGVAGGSEDVVRGGAWDVGARDFFKVWLCKAIWGYLG